ncbi:hypothetical protein TRVA0_007S02740 [Trichomonascus vanleenenianus]|uniref:uncharacterized protein n=1 Tax=Trichomonascus vanleenenianus TaxID=2268995 RepID=UPI003EC9E3D7
MFSPQINKQENECIDLDGGQVALEWIAYGNPAVKEVGLQEQPANHKDAIAAPLNKSRKPRGRTKAKKDDQYSSKSPAMSINQGKAILSEEAVASPIAPSSQYSSGVNSTDRSREQYVKIGYPEGETISPKVVVTLPPIDLSPLGPPHHRMKFGPFYEDNVKEKTVELDEESLFLPEDCSEISEGAQELACSNTFSKKSWFKKKTRNGSATSTSTFLPIKNEDYYWDPIDGGIVVSSPKKKLSSHQLRRKKSSKLLLRPKKSKQSIIDTPKQSFFAKLFSKKQ